MLDEIVRVGVITNVYPEKGTVRVKLVDVDDQISYELPVIFAKTHKDKAYYMPDVGEHVVCLFSGQGLEQGFVLGAIYSRADTVPVASNDKFHLRFEDGTWIEYDKKEHILRASVNGEVEIHATKVTIVGNLEVAGNIHATGAIIDEGGNTNHHSH